MYVHGDNLATKMNSSKKYSDGESRSYLGEIKAQYDAWRGANEKLVGPTAKIMQEEDYAVIERRTQLLREYKDFIDQKVYAEAFDARSNLHSSVIEEFLYYLFRDLVAGFGENALIGKSHAFKDLFFVPPSYAAMLRVPHARVERKDHDFVIGAKVGASFRTLATTVHDEIDVGLEGEGPNKAIDHVQVGGAVDAASDRSGDEQLTFDIPAVAIECKTYLDKTMLEGSSRAADEIKARNPNGIYVVLCERLKLSGAVNLRKYSVDQIYVLRREKNVDREYRLQDDWNGNAISADVVVHLFEKVRGALITDWSVGLDEGVERGWLL
jgi:hypothetical protein